MKAIIPVVLLFAFTFVVGHQDKFSRSVESCHLYRDVTQDYRLAMYEFNILMYRNMGYDSSYHFIYSPLSVWIIIAAIAEGAEAHAQQQMFRLLGLPNDPCVRLRYYQLATTRYLPGSDVNIVSTRTLVVDQRVTVNPYWHNFVSNNGFIDLVLAPIRHDPQAALNYIRLLSSSTLRNIDLTGNSVLIDTMDYNGLWKTAFSDAIIHRSPFYDSYGRKIGAVDLMRVSKRARVAFIPKINTKILELPVGFDDRYRILVGLILDTRNIESLLRTIKKTIVSEVLNETKESYVPIEIAIPTFTMTSEIDVRRVLESLGINSLWRDPSVTRYISDPPLLPSSFVQRSTITLDNHGIYPPPYTGETPRNVSTGLDPAVGKDFTANRPFLFALFDTETYSVLMASIYTQPTYRY